MTMQAAIQVEDLNKFLRAVRRAGREDIAEAIKAANREAADDVAQAAQEGAPSLTGTLAGTIRGSGTLRAGVVRAGRAAVPYAGPIHFGWPARNIEPNPFLYDALDERKREVLDAYRKRVEDVLDRIAAST